MINIYLMTDKIKPFYGIKDLNFLGINHTLSINKRFYNIDRIVHNITNKEGSEDIGTANTIKIYVSEITK